MNHYRWYFLMTIKHSSAVSRPLKDSCNKIDKVFNMSKTKTTICKELIKDYCANCSFAGIHYIADENKHVTER